MKSNDWSLFLFYLCQKMIRSQQNFGSDLWLIFIGWRLFDSKAVHLFEAFEDEVQVKGDKY